MTQAYKNPPTGGWSAGQPGFYPEHREIYEWNYKPYFARKQARKEPLIERMGGKWQVIAQITVVVLTIAAMLIIDHVYTEKERRELWIASYPMANQHIEWENFYTGGNGK